MSRNLVDSGPLKLSSDTIIHRGYRFDDAGLNNAARSRRWIQCIPGYVDYASDTDDMPTCLWCVGERTR